MVDKDNSKTDIIEKSEQIGHKLEKAFLTFLDPEMRKQYYAHEARISWRYRRACVVGAFIIWLTYLPLDLQSDPVINFLIVRIIGSVIIWAFIAPRAIIFGRSFATHSETIVTYGAITMAILELVWKTMRHEDDFLSIDLYLVSIAIFLLCRFPFWKAIIICAIFLIALFCCTLFIVKPNKEVTVLTFVYFIGGSFSGGFGSYAFHKKLRSSFMISRLSNATTALQVYSIMKESNRFTLMFADRSLEREFWQSRWHKNKNFARKTLVMSIFAALINTGAYYLFHVDTNKEGTFWLIRGLMVLCTLVFVFLTYFQLSAFISAAGSVALMTLLYGGFQFLEYMADSLFIQQLYRLSIINILICMYFITFSLVTTSILVIHSVLAGTWEGVMDVAFCAMISIFVYYVLELESRRSFLWRYFCAPNFEEDIRRTTIMTHVTSVEKLDEISPKSNKSAWHPTP